MDLRSAAGTSITVLLVLIAILILVTQVFGFPSPISFVATDSMEPQLEPGDGFIGIPEPLAGEIAPGDVITFEAQRLGGGGLTTHRVVEKTEQGYLTKGDANPFRDQAAGEPPVQQSQIRLKAVQINDKIIVIPNVGDVSNAAEGVIGSVITGIGLGDISPDNPGITVAILGLVMVLGAGGYDFISDDTARLSRRSPSRNVIDSRLLLVAVLLVLSLPLLSITALPSGTSELSIESSTASTDNPAVIEPGNYTETNTTVENSQILPMVIIIEPASEGLEVSNSVLSAGSDETVTTKIKIWAPEEPGRYVRSRAVHFYIHVLPANTIGFLHRIHPFVALTVTTSVMLLPVAILFLLIVGNRKIPLREVSR
ncbi:signal peptidase I [Halonotius aquaticus]|uniref:Signal peptidase I n=1 Tax=Halonotius aquaticus TaxID=2216978 RepID=A0A3A6PS50_9EURY|nr:signal peptidase I [Halonotius aquaticus]RJX44733.1 signal peptidase I [Halonotius aquaticus]